MSLDEKFYLTLPFAFAAMFISGSAGEPANEPLEAAENPLPDADEISTMEVRLDQPSPVIQEFEVPRNH